MEKYKEALRLQCLRDNMHLHRQLTLVKKHQVHDDIKTSMLTDDIDDLEQELLSKVPDRLLNQLPL
ncbi:MAG: hypothetical protein AAGF85_00510 [Bacteroidota bacterium]